LSHSRQAKTALQEWTPSIIQGLRSSPCPFYALSVATLSNKSSLESLDGTWMNVILIIETRQTEHSTDRRQSMKAFFIHDTNKQLDLMAIPETDYVVPVDRVVMEAFIAVAPDFSRYTGQRLNGLPPETFGRIVATRETDGDVCIVEESLWGRRMAHHLGFTTK
jgi:hypothetical protein